MQLMPQYRWPQRLGVLSRGLIIALVLSTSVEATRSEAQSSAGDPPAMPPAAAVRSVTDKYFGVSVGDPYRYLENLKDPDVAAWFQSENQYTRTVLERIPGRAALLEKIKQYDQSAPALVSSVRRLPSGRYFYEKRLASEDVPKLYLRDGLNGEEKLVVDPAQVCPRQRALGDQLL